MTTFSILSITLSLGLSFAFSQKWGTAVSMMWITLFLCEIDSKLPPLPAPTLIVQPVMHEAEMQIPPLEYPSN